MTRILIFIILIFSAMTGHSQINDRAGQEIRKLMNEWMVAVMKRDEKTLNKIVAPEFKLDGTYPFDKPAVTREMWMTNGMHHLKIDSVHYYNMKVDIIDQVAVVQSKFFWSGSFHDKPFVDSTSVLVDTWMKRQQGWQVVSRIRVDKPE